MNDTIGLRTGSEAYREYIDRLVDDDATKLVMEAVRMAGEELCHLMGNPHAGMDHPLKRSELSVTILERALACASKDMATTRTEATQ